MIQKKIKCPNCNRHTYMQANSDNKTCPYCGSEIVIGNNIDVPSKSIVVVISIIIIVIALFIIFKVRININEIKYNINENNNFNENTKPSGNTNEEVRKNFKYNYNTNLSSIKKEQGKVNVYIFWGNGCPHCTEAHNFFDSIGEEYSEYFNIYGFEVWYNSDNKSLFKKFAAAMNDETSGVPYIIIGNKSFKGYINSWNNDILNAIIDGHNKDFDIYFDVIKKKIK